MHAELQRAQQGVCAVVENQYERLARLPRPELRDLLHEADDVSRTQQGSARVAAQITVTVCEVLLEK